MKLRFLFLGLGGISIAIACADRLEDFDSFPCATDGSCPASYSCTKAGICKLGNATDTACSATTTTCVEGNCIGSVCLPPCAAGCATGRICSYPSPGETGQLAHCVVDCSAGQACPNGMQCFPLYNDKKGCVPATATDIIDRACAAPQDCQGTRGTFLPITCAQGRCTQFCSTVPEVKCADQTRACVIADPIINSGCIGDGGIREAGSGGGTGTGQNR